MGGCDAPGCEQPEPSHEIGAKRDVERWAARQIIDRKQRGQTDLEDRLCVQWGIVPVKSWIGVLAGNG